MRPVPVHSLEFISIAPSKSRATSRLATGLLDLVFPPRCSGCHRLGQVLCDRCLAQVQPLAEPACPRCGQPLDRGELCRSCQGGRFAVSMIGSAAAYAPPLDAAIRDFKYQGVQELKVPLGRLLVQAWEARSWAVDMVASVPLHERRRRERGFDQAWLLAEQFCLATGLSLLAPSMLRRQRYTEQQVRLSPAERQRNVAGAFAWQGGFLDGLDILLIDDVITSGATLEACGQVLRAAGAGRVVALTVARAVHGKDS